MKPASPQYYLGRALREPPRAAAAGWLVLGLAILVALWTERAEIGMAGIAAVGLVSAVCPNGWWRRHRAAVATITLDVALLFLFLWSLDEREHVVVQVTHGQYVGSMGTASVRIGAPASSGRFGFYAGPLFGYRVSPLGEARMATPSSLLERFGAWMRLALAPAWTNIRVISAGRSATLISQPEILSGTWRVNHRGEVGGSPFSNVLFGQAPSGDYRIEADLMRGDGTQGILVGVDSADRGFLFEARADVPDVQWVGWSSGLEGDGLGGSTTVLPTEATFQRDIRLLLANAWWAFVLLALALPVYLALRSLFRAFGGTGEDELLPLESALQSRVTPLMAAGLLALAAAVLTALVASMLLERIPHVQDSVADLFQAKTYALGRLWVPDPRLHNFFSEEFIPVRNGMWFGKYPPGWPLVLTIGVLVHAPWLVDPILSGLIVLLVFAIGRELYSTPIGLLAALLTVTSPFFLFLGGSFMPHTATTFFLLSAVYLYVCWYRRAERLHSIPRVEAAYLIPAGFLLGMALITRQADAIAFALPFAAFLVPSIRRARLRPLLWPAVGIIPPVAFLLFYNWQLAGSPLSSPYTLWWPFDRLGFGPTIGFGGFTLAQGLWNTSFNLQMLLAHAFGWPFYLTLALAALPFLTGRANRWDWTLAGSSGAVIAAYVAYWNPGVMYGPRYYFPLLPCMALLSARGLEELYRWPLRLPSRTGHDRVAALAIPGALLALLLSYNATVYMPAQIPIYRGYNYTSAASIDAVQRAGIHHALIFVVSNPPGEWWSYGAVFSSNSPLLDGDIVYARDFGAMDRQLMQMYRGRVYYRLDGTILTRLSA